ncbi:hypothetical protein Tco_0819786 [Tanacetum coccineum]|uniref:Uncharacterized protein n=1 Tax=Tanacetum coccineum TaxID=301880 RepID=A0ABQ5AAK2_9ASTR
MPKFNKWLSSLLRNKEKLEEIAITTVNAECSAIIMNKVPEKLEDPGKFLIPCALQELDRTSGFRLFELSITILTHSNYKKLGLEAYDSTLDDTRACHPLIEFVMKETLNFMSSKGELVYYADKSEKNKDKNFVHAISIIDFSKANPFSGSTTTRSDDPSPSSSPMKTSDNFEKFADELAPLNSLPPECAYDNFKSSYVNPLLEENDKDVEIKSSSSFILTSPEESEFEADSIPSGIDLTLPPTFEYQVAILLPYSY